MHGCPHLIHMNNCQADFLHDYQLAPLEYEWELLPFFAYTICKGYQLGLTDYMLACIQYNQEVSDVSTCLYVCGLKVHIWVG